MTVLLRDAIDFAIASLLLTIPLACLLMLPGAVWRLWTHAPHRRMSSHREGQTVALALVLSCLLVALAL